MPEEETDLNADYMDMNPDVDLEEDLE